MWCCKWAGWGGGRGRLARPLAIRQPLAAATTENTEKKGPSRPGAGPLGVYENGRCRQSVGGASLASGQQAGLATRAVPGAAPRHPTQQALGGRWARPPLPSPQDSRRTACAGWGTCGRRQGADMCWHVLQCCSSPLGLNRWGWGMRSCWGAQRPDPPSPRHRSPHAVSRTRFAGRCGGSASRWRRAASRARQSRPAPAKIA